MSVYPDEELPEGSVVDANALRRDASDEFDFVVVGSGAAGSVAAHRLTELGFRVGLVEEGPWVKTREFGADVRSAFARMMRDGGMQAIRGRAFMPLLQGRCVGGSTVINSAIAWRTPGDVLADWRERFGLGDVLSEASLAPHFDVLERDLHVRPTQREVWGENNRLFLKVAEEAGFSPQPMNRYERGCRGSGRCLTGCPHAAKQGMNVSYIPWALTKGARIYHGARVEHVEIQGDRATGVVAKNAEGQRLFVRARHGVFVAASTVQTPNLLRRSGLRSRALGAHFQAHPGVGLAGVFDHPVDMAFGATQGAEVIHFRKSDRFKLETLAMQPELAAARIPGVGHELAARMAMFRHVAVWVVQVRALAEGRVKSTWGGADLVEYTMTEADMRALRRGCAVLADLYFQAGAKEVWPGIFGIPPVLREASEVRFIEDGPIDPRAYSCVATHLFGAARMAPDPRAGVVGTDFATHEAKALYVVDSSIFPTNLGVNPQHSIMAIARLAATRAAEAARKG